MLELPHGWKGTNSQERQMEQNREGGRISCQDDDFRYSAVQSLGSFVGSCMISILLLILLLK
jgi:hypothetical protein